MYRALLLAALGAALLAAEAAAQPALERLEQRLRAEPQSGQRPAPKEPAYLGAMADDRFDLGRGVRVVDLVPDGPAAAAGLHRGDLITSAGGRSIRQMADLGAVVEAASAGDRLRFVVLRGGEERTLVVVFGKRPPAPAGSATEPQELPPPDEAGPRGRSAGRPGAFGELPPPPGIDRQAVDAEAEARPGRNSFPGPALVPPAGADAAPPEPGGAAKRIADLERRIAELERRLAQVEQLLRDGRP